MQLKPCVQCRRHLARESVRCPFCDALQDTALSGRFMAHAGRVSRAAIFASAAACGSTTPAPHGPPPPPPPDPVLVQRFATAPPPVAGKASVRGFVTVDGRPLTGTAVTARYGDGETELKTTTGAHGEYEFVDIDPGRWVLVVDYEMPRHRPQDYSPPSEEQVQLEPGANVRNDIQLVTPPAPEPDRGPCCKPYGAPPARRRIV